MKTELRDGLVEVPGGLPTFASEGLEGAAATIGGIAADSYEYLAGLLGIRPEAQVLVLSEADWATKCEQPLYGLPNAGDGTLTVAGTEAPFWADLADMVADDDRAELEAVYAGRGWPTPVRAVLRPHRRPRGGPPVQPGLRRLPAVLALGVLRQPLPARVGRAAIARVPRDPDHLAATGSKGVGGHLAVSHLG